MARPMIKPVILDMRGAPAIHWNLFDSATSCLDGDKYPPWPKTDQHNPAKHIVRYGACQNGEPATQALGLTWTRG